MSMEYLLASGSEFTFDAASLVEAAQRRWPDADIVRPTGQLEELVECYIYLPAPDLHRTELTVSRTGESVGVDSDKEEEVAEVAAWVAQTVPVPKDGSFVLIHWDDLVVPLTPDTTVDTLLAMHR